jgi:hypothetical protein
MKDYFGQDVGPGDWVYVDLGDSVTDGGEFTDEVAKLDELGLRTKRGHFVPAARFEQVFVEVLPR